MTNLAKPETLTPVLLLQDHWEYGQRGQIVSLSEAALAEMSKADWRPPNQAELSIFEKSPNTVFK